MSSNGEYEEVEYILKSLKNPTEEVKTNPS